MSSVRGEKTLFTRLRIIRGLSASCLPESKTIVFVSLAVDLVCPHSRRLPAYPLTGSNIRARRCRFEVTVGTEKTNAFRAPCACAIPLGESGRTYIHGEGFHSRHQFPWSLCLCRSSTSRGNRSSHRNPLALIHGIPEGLAYEGKGKGYPRRAERDRSAHERFRGSF